MDDIEKKARVLLAAECFAEGWEDSGNKVLKGDWLDEAAEGYKVAIRAIVAALRAAPAADGAGVPDGWVLVPVEPTDEMLEQACTHNTTPRTAKDDEWNRATWALMIDGSPSAPEQRAVPAEQQDAEVDAVISVALALIRDAEEFETADGLMQAAQLHLWHELEDAIEKVGPAEVINYAALAARQPETDEQQGAGDARAQFEAWAKSVGLIAVSYGIRSENSQCDTAFAAWQAALASRQPSGFTAGDIADAAAGGFERGQAVPEDVRRDAERLEWLMRMVSGKELRDIGVDTYENCTREAIDAAMAAQPQGEGVGRG